MMLTSRPYQHPQDFAKLAAFLSHTRTAIHHTHYLHPGDLTWQLFLMLATDHPADLIQIWQDSSGDLPGFVFAVSGLRLLRSPARSRPAWG